MSTAPTWFNTKSTAFMPGTVERRIAICAERPSQMLLTALLPVWSGMARMHAAQMAIAYGMDGRGS